MISIGDTVEFSRSGKTFEGEVQGYEDGKYIVDTGSGEWEVDLEEL